LQAIGERWLRETKWSRRQGKFELEGWGEESAQTLPLSNLWDGSTAAPIFILINLN
jgi:hypothetical protein